MFNLAPIKYRKISAQNGGPIARIVSTPITILGTPNYQSQAFLNPSLIVPQTPRTLRRAADGTGESTSASKSRSIAITEALKRWAYYSESTQPNKRCGFEHDPSMRGLAALPCLLRRQSQKRAQLDALRDFALVSWWDRRISVRHIHYEIPTIKAVRFEHALALGEVVMLYRQTRAGLFSYGIASGSNLKEAISRAVLDLIHFEFSVTYHTLTRDEKKTDNFIQSRCMYFASQEGRETFLDRLHSKPTQTAYPWQPIFDGEIHGPWSEYATVWRTIVEMPTMEHLDPKQNFFFW